MDLRTISTAQLEDIVRETGYRNSLAHKGHRYLTATQRAENAEIYRGKSDKLYALALEYLRRGLDVAFDPASGVVFFRLKCGVQVSFHVSPDSRDKIIDQFKSLSLPSAIWDGVEHAFAYFDYSEYLKVMHERVDVLSALSKYREQLISKEYSAIKEYLSKYRRAEKLGIDLTTDLIRYKFGTALHASYDTVSRVYWSVFGMSEKAYARECADKIREFVSSYNPRYRYTDWDVREVSPKQMPKEDDGSREEN